MLSWFQALMPRVGRFKKDIVVAKLFTAPMSIVTTAILFELASLVG